MSDPTTEQLTERLADLKYRVKDAHDEVAVAIQHGEVLNIDPMILTHLNTAKGLLTERP